MSGLLCLAGSLLYRAGHGAGRLARDAEALGELLVATGQTLYGIAGALER